MANRENITPELLCQLLRYEPKTGKLFWKDSNLEAFTSNRKGYRVGAVNKFMFSAHRVAWAMHYGEWPNGQIDHINHIRNDNRIENLRDISPHENSKNLGLSTRNKSGFSGVRYKKNINKWESFIHHNFKYYWLGNFDKIEDAVNARNLAKINFGFHDNHGSL